MTVCLLCLSSFIYSLSIIGLQGLLWVPKSEPTDKKLGPWESRGQPSARELNPAGTAE
jgi:hypothetical protein